MGFRVLSEPTVRKRNAHAKRVIFSLVIAALFAGCSGCSQCKSCKTFDNTKAARTPLDVTDFSVVFIEGEATLFWTDSKDSSFDYIEVTWGPGGEEPLRVEKGIGTLVIPGLEVDTVYNFAVKAVDQWGNKSSGAAGGTGKAHKHRRSAYAHSDEILSIKGTPLAGQTVLSWTNLGDSEYDHIEITYDSNSEVLIQVPKGAESRMLMGLTNGIEHTFYAVAVDANGNQKSLREVGLFISDVDTSSEGVTLLTPTGDVEMFVIKGKPVAGQIRLDWNDPAIALDHVEIMYNPGGWDKPVIIGKGTVTKAFSGLSDDHEYGFIVYGVDVQGNKWPIRDVRLTTPTVSRIVAKPVSRKVTIVWTDPKDPNLSHIEVNYSPGSEKAVRVEKGVQTYTFTGLSDSIEYEFFVKAVTLDRNSYIVAGASAVTSKLPVLVGKPIDGRLSLMWDDLKDVNVDHVEIIYSPGGENARMIAKGMENQTFTDLIDDRQYSFTVYAVDPSNNKYPILSAKFYVPELAVASPPVQRGSLNDLIWKSVNDTSFGESTIYTLSYGALSNGSMRWVAGGADGKLAYSADNGINWTPVGNSTFGSFSVNAIGYNAGRWIATGNSGKIAWSTNVVNWTPVKETHFTIEGNIYAIAYGNGCWVAGGTGGQVIISEDNGITWNPVIISDFDHSTINAIAFHGNRWIAGGMKGKIAYSDNNGLTWTTVSSAAFSNSDVKTIVFDRGRWMMGGYGASTAWSSDGISWRNLARPFYILGMGYNGERWVAGGQEGRLAWSGDSGDTWHHDDLVRGLFGNSWVQAVAFGHASAASGRWLSAGQKGIILYADE